MGLPDYVALETSGLSSPVGVEVEPEHVVLIKGLSSQPLSEIFAAVLRECLIADAPVQFDVVLLPTVIPSVDVKVGALDDEGGVGLDGELAKTPVKRKSCILVYIYGTELQIHRVQCSNQLSFRIKS